MADQSSGATTAAIAGAAVSAMGNYAGEIAKGKRQWKYQQKAMDKQQQLNLEAWNMQNAYNTPQAQMERLQAAGLNPRLIYGSGAGGGQSAPLVAPEAPVREAVGGPKIPDMFQYFQVRQMDAQYKATMQNIQNMQASQTLTHIRSGLENLKLFRENLRARNYPELQAAELDTAKFVALRQQELFANEKTKGNLMDQLQDVRGEQMKGIKLDNAFKTHRNELSKLGIYTSDHPAFRILIQAAARMNIDLGSLLAEGAQGLKYLLDLAK